MKEDLYSYKRIWIMNVSKCFIRYSNIMKYVSPFGLSKEYIDEKWEIFFLFGTMKIRNDK